MRLSLATSALAFASAHAFSNSSPFVLFSTTKLDSTPNASSPRQLQSSSQVLASAKDLLSSCPTEKYLLVSQANLHATDIRGPNGCSMPHLCDSVTSATTQTLYSVAEVMGPIQRDALAEHIRTSCLAHGRVADIQEADLTALPPPTRATMRAKVLAENDNQLHGLLTALDTNFTLLLFSDPAEPTTYEADFVGSVPMDLKRHLTPPPPLYKRADQTDNRPLFEKYQFFTPGIFMGLIALFIMLAILFAGLKALLGLQVPYAAFEKEMGPQGGRSSNGR